MALVWFTNFPCDQEFKTSFKAIEGEPKATEKYSVAELKKMGMKGIYRETSEEKKPS